MEKIVNMQAPGSMPAAAGTSRRAQANVQETTDDFIRLLQQQKETAKQPEDTKDTKKNNSTQEVKPEEKQEKEPVEEPVEEDADPKEELAELTQLELEIQQSILQQNIVQSAEPETADLQAAVPEVPAVEEIVPETAVELTVQEQAPEAAVRTEQVKPEPVRAEEHAEPVKAEAPLQAETKAEQPVEAPQESREDQGGQLSEKPKDAKVPAAERRETVREEKLPEAADAPEQSPEVRTAETPVQKQEEVPESRFQAGETTVKATMEELPEKLGKAVTVGKPGESHTLTVELEPASLGKMTIRLQYEAGRTLVSVMASNPKTLELLHEKATEIAAILKERTGEETVIYTEETQREPGEEAQEQGNRGGQPEERRQHKEEDRSQTESFMQQLRLGLV